MPLDVRGHHVDQPRNRQATTATVEEVLHWKGSRCKLTVAREMFAARNEPREPLFVTDYAG